MSQFKYGDRVRHDDFGEGWVEDDRATGTVLVNFDERDEAEIGCSPSSLEKLD